METETKKILKNCKTIAVIGCSRNPGKPAHDVPEYLQKQGYKIIPVNPSAKEILGEKCYKNATDISAEIQKKINKLK